MTQHQAPEVTSEDREAAADLYQTVHAPDENPQDIRIADSIRKGNNDHWSWVKAFAAHRTRATQPLSLAVDEEAVDRAARAISLVDVNYDFDALGRSTKEHYRRMARAALGEQIAENANCSGDIDRSGLAQEVEFSLSQRPKPRGFRDA